MSLIDQAASKTDHADILILANVETIRDQDQPATASAVASLIGGAPVRDIQARLMKMQLLGLLEDRLTLTKYQLTAMGAELVRKQLEGWTPSLREEERRESELRAILSGIRRTG